MKDAFGQYKVFVYDYKLKEVEFKSRNSSRLISPKSVNSLPVLAHQTQQFSISSMSGHEESKETTKEMYKTTKMEDFRKNRLNSPSPIKTFALTSPNDHRVSSPAPSSHRSSLHESFNSFFPNINPDLMRFIQSLLLSDEVTLLSIKQPVGSPRSCGQLKKVSGCE